MPLRGLRTSRSGKELRRRSTLEPFQLAPPELDDAPQRGTVSSDFPTHERPITSGDESFVGKVRRISAFADTDDSAQQDPDSPRKSMDSPWNRHSFNF